MGSVSWEPLHSMPLVQDMRLALPSRLARKLLDLCDTHGKPTEAGVRIALPLSQRELGG